MTVGSTLLTTWQRVNPSESPSYKSSMKTPSIPRELTHSVKALSSLEPSASSRSGLHFSYSSAVKGSIPCFVLKISAQKRISSVSYASVMSSRVIISGTPIANELVITVAAAAFLS